MGNNQPIVHPPSGRIPGAPRVLMLCGDFGFANSNFKLQLLITCVFYFTLADEYDWFVTYHYLLSLGFTVHITSPNLPICSPLRLMRRRKMVFGQKNISYPTGVGGGEDDNDGTSKQNGEDGEGGDSEPIPEYLMQFHSAGERQGSKV